MNKKQRTLLLVISAILLLMLLFPPYHIEYRGEMVRNMGYHFIGNPPVRESTLRGVTVEFGSKITSTTLLFQYLFTMSIGGILFFVLKDKK